MIMVLNVASGLMIMPMANGLWTLEPWATALGLLGLVGGQLWALDRYAWLYADMTSGLEERSAASGHDRWLELSSAGGRLLQANPGLSGLRIANSSGSRYHVIL